VASVRECPLNVRHYDVNVGRVASLAPLGLREKLGGEHLRRRTYDHEHQLVLALETKLNLDGIVEHEVRPAMFIGLPLLTEVDRRSVLRLVEGYQHASSVGDLPFGCSRTSRCH
jgi:hypothetical protein